MSHRINIAKNGKFVCFPEMLKDFKDHFTFGQVEHDLSMEKPLLDMDSNDISSPYNCSYFGKERWIETRR